MSQKHHHQLLLDDESQVTESLDWKGWVLIETVRRTIFFVHVINALSAGTQKQSSFFYEALDTDLILDMSLPAADSCWHARTAEQWSAARSARAKGPRMTARMVRQGGTNIPREDLTEFARLILSTLDMNVGV